MTADNQIDRTRRESFKEAILTIDRLEGVQGVVTIDRFGDSQRKIFLTMIVDGKFKALEY